MLTADLLRHRREIATAVRNHKYEVSPTGIHIPAIGNIGGVFESWLNGADHQVHANLFTTEGRDHTLAVLVANGAIIPTWYCALFEGNVTPQATWTGFGATGFDSQATEFTGYDEPGRVEFIDGTISAGSVSNTASKADFTVSAGVANKSLYGAGLLSVSLKEAPSTGKLLAASLFSSVRVVNATDVLTVQYTLSLTST